MKKIIIILVVMSSLLGCSEDTFVGSGETISEFRQVALFNKVSSEGTFNVVITKGDEQSVEIIADHNLMHRVRTDVVNGKLKLYLLNGNYNNVHLKAYITLLSLDEVENSGAGDIHVLNNFEAGNFKITNSGAAFIFLEGNCASLDIRNEGVGNIFGQYMTSNNCTIKNIGAGDIEVNCQSNLSVKIEGSGSVYYKGSPSITATISGSGQVINDN